QLKRQHRIAITPLPHPIDISFHVTALFDLFFQVRHSPPKDDPLEPKVLTKTLPFIVEPPTDFILAYRRIDTDLVSIKIIAVRFMSGSESPSRNFTPSVRGNRFLL